ncbi:MAG: fumarylacetoacetate hydrolase family protein [Sulfobacillus sp.]|nr:fumarylacetoacetate hydrolase family protein [Sulfobacillus sp.]
MTGPELNRWADHVWHHQCSATPMARITEEVPHLTVEDGYAIQARLIDRRTASGEHLIGYKMGLTSEAKQHAVGVSLPIYGRLTDLMELHAPIVDRSRLIHPRVEPELAIVLKRGLAGSVPLRDVLTAIECVLPAWEVIDSRYEGFSFTAADVVADNASAAQFYLSPYAFSPYGRDWAEIGVTVRHNGHVRHVASAAAVLGHPWEAVRRLASLLSREDRELLPGQVILTGGITDAVPLSPGDRLQMAFGTLGVLDVVVPVRKEDANAPDPH